MMPETCTERDIANALLEVEGGLRVMVWLLAVQVVPEGNPTRFVHWIVL